MRRPWPTLLEVVANGTPGYLHERMTRFFPNLPRVGNEGKESARGAQDSGK
jgi:hypothetical protein